MTKQDSLLQALGAILPKERVLSAPEDLAVYAFDATALLYQLPVCVLMPDTVEQIVGVLRVATEFGVPVVTRGSGTGLAGGAVPSQGAIVLCLVRLNRILEVDTAKIGRAHV